MTKKKNIKWISGAIGLLVPFLILIIVSFFSDLEINIDLITTLFFIAGLPLGIGGLIAGHLISKKRSGWAVVVYIITIVLVSIFDLLFLALYAFANMDF